MQHGIGVGGMDNIEKGYKVAFFRGVSTTAEISISNILSVGYQ